MGQSTKLPSQSIRPKESGCLGVGEDRGVYRGILRTQEKLAQWEAAIVLTTDACFCNYVIHAHR